MDGTDSEAGTKRDSVVIVALPDSMNRHVYKVSSEKKPHLTLLFLGETDFGGESAAVVQFIEHAAKTSLRRFGLSVTRRGTLGEDDADVLFFDKDYLSKEIENFRAALLGHPHISTAYNQAEQYPEWIPHLTLGYPEAPAKKDDEDYEISWVNFDRIAIWTGDSEGPEFLLSQDRMTEVAMSSTPGANAAESVLSHYGVKGMKWGVRRTDAQLARASSKKADDKSEDAKRASEIASKIGKKGDLSRLSNQEIQTLVQRLNTEQQYARLVSEGARNADKTAIARGRDFATSLAVEVGKQQIKRIAKEAGNRGGDQLGKAMGIDLAKKGGDKSSAPKPKPKTTPTSAKVTAPKTKKKKQPKSYTPTPINVNPSSISVRPTD